MYNAIYEQAKIKSGEFVMIHPPDGSMGQAAVHMARSRGAKVICTMAEDNQVNRSIGVMAYANPRSPSFEKDIEEFTGGQGVKVVIQTGGEALPTSIAKSLAYGARICKVGCDKPTISAISGVRFSAINLSSIIRRHPQKIQKMVTSVKAFLENHPVNTSENQQADIAELECRLLTIRNTATTVFTIPEDYYPEHMSLTEVDLKKDSTYLVTGGYGRLGRELARWLVQKGAQHIAMASRTGASDVFKKSTVNYLEKYGATVLQHHH